MKSMKVILEKKRVHYVWLDTWADSGESLESMPPLAVWIMGNFFLVYFGQSFEFAGSQSIFGVSRTLPCVCAHSAIKYFTWRMGRNIPLASLPLASKESFCTCVVKEVSWLQEWEICSLGRAQPPHLIVLLLKPWIFSPQGMNFQSLLPCRELGSILLQLY